jgi:hypothetical protein
MVGLAESGGGGVPLAKLIRHGGDQEATRCIVKKKYKGGQKRYRMWSGLCRRSRLARKYTSALPEHALSHRKQVWRCLSHGDFSNGPGLCLIIAGCRMYFHNTILSVQKAWIPSRKEQWAHSLTVIGRVEEHISMERSTEHGCATLEAQNYRFAEELNNINAAE